MACCLAQISLGCNHHQSIISIISALSLTVDALPLHRKKCWFSLRPGPEDCKHANATPAAAEAAAVGAAQTLNDIWSLIQGRRRAKRNPKRRPKIRLPPSSFSSRYWASAGYQNGKVSQPCLLFRNTLKQCEDSKNTLQYPIVYRPQINLSQVIIASQLGSFWAHLIDLFTQTAKLGKFYNIPGTSTVSAVRVFLEPYSLLTQSCPEMFPVEFSKQTA